MKTKLNSLHVTSRVAAICEVSLDFLRGPSRTPEACTARGLAMLILRERGMTLNQVGRCFNDRTHATVLHTLEKTRRRIAKDPLTGYRYKRVLEIIEAEETED